MRIPGRRTALLLAVFALNGATLAQEDAPQPTPTPPEATAETAGADEPTRLDPVEVTAQKRTQLLQDVPMGISVVRGQELEESGAKSFTDYAQTVPGLNFASRGEGQTGMNIRGMNAVTGVPTVSWLVDDVSEAITFGSPDAELFDINRIEVLRGPQGTLYGEGAVGGAIKIITNKPDPQQWQAKAAGGLGSSVESSGEDDVNAMINVPLVHDALALRVVGYQRSSDGYITVREPEYDNPPGFPKDYSNQNIVVEDANTTKSKGARAALAWYPSQLINLTLRGATQDLTPGYSPAVSPSLQPAFGEYNHVRGFGSVADYTNMGYDQASAVVDLNLESMNIESISGYADILSESSIPFFVDFGGIADMLESTLSNQYDIRTQELRFSSSPGGVFTLGGDLLWTTGLFYKTQDRVAQQIVHPGPNATFAGFPDPLQQVDLTEDYEEIAAYGQVEYKFTDAWSLLTGLRVFQGELTTDTIVVDTDGNPQPYHRTAEFEDVSPKLTLAWHYTDGVMLYGTAAKGFRIGGNNIALFVPQSPDFQPDYGPDEAWSYELGANTVLLDGRMSLNAAVFHVDWKDLQQDLLISNSDGETQRITSNAGKAHSRGVELELESRLAWNFTGRIFGAYLDAALDEDAPNPNVPGGVIPEGTGLENVPHVSGGASLAHVAPFGNGYAVNSALVWTHRGQTHGDYLNTDTSISDAYDLYNLRLGVGREKSGWNVTGFVDNIFDEDASSFTFRTSLDTVYRLPSRTAGLRASYAF